MPEIALLAVQARPFGLAYLPTCLPISTPDLVVTGAPYDCADRITYLMTCHVVACGLRGPVVAGRHCVHVGSPCPTYAPEIVLPTPVFDVVLLRIHIYIYIHTLSGFSVRQPTCPFSV